MPTKDDILGGAMQLSPEERIEVAERLLESVDIDPAVEEAWAEEIARRIADIDSGRVSLVPWEEVRRRMAE